LQQQLLKTRLDENLLDTEALQAIPGPAKANCPNGFSRLSVQVNHSNISPSINCQRMLAGNGIGSIGVKIPLPAVDSLQPNQIQTGNIDSLK